MDNLLAAASHLLATLLARLGIGSIPTSDAVFYLLGMLVFLMFCAGVRSAIRGAVLRCSPRR